MLVARAAPPTEVFMAVAEEVGHVFPADATFIGRYDGDVVTVVGCWSERGAPTCFGERIAIGGHNLVTLVVESGRPARVDDYHDASGSLVEHAREVGFRSGLGVPITVAGRLWGMMAVLTAAEAPLPYGTQQLADFTELIATAVANTEARRELHMLANEQAALRRLATLVARAVAPAEIFTALSEEATSVFGADRALVVRLDVAGRAIVVAAVGAEQAIPVGTIWDLKPPWALGSALTTGQPARVDDYSGFSGPVAEVVAGLGIRCSVACPVVVGGRLWGAIVIASRAEPFPSDTEHRLAEFTELLATAIANAEAATEVTASRARIVASADEARRRIQRDLHDGAQQRLVSLALRLRAAQATIPPYLEGLATALGDVAAGLDAALDELRELARGIHPVILTTEGLEPALQSLARASGLPVSVRVAVQGRPAAPVEVAAYYVVSEALANAAKYASASKVVVAVETEGGVLRIRVEDDGAGGADMARGSGLLGLKDRVESLGGRIALLSEPGSGTCLSVELPCRPAAMER